MLSKNKIKYIRSLELKKNRKEEQVFIAENGKLVRGLVEEIRSKKYYLPELELIMVNEDDEVIGYAMFSRFHIEGRYEDELLMITPVAVKTELQRQHISKEIIPIAFIVVERASTRCLSHLHFLQTLLIVGLLATPDILANIWQEPKDSNPDLIVRSDICYPLHHKKFIYKIKKE